MHSLHCSRYKILFFHNLLQLVGPKIDQADGKGGVYETEIVYHS